MPNFHQFLILLCLLICPLISHSLCIDGYDNVVILSDASPELPIQFENVVARLYDSQWRPSCFNGQANLLFPGIMQLTSGTLTVNKKLPISANGKGLLTAKKNSLLGYVCLEGKSKSALPDKDCTLDICHGDGNLCNLLEQPGTYSLDQIEASTGINGTIFLHKMSELLGPLLKGQWKLELSVRIGDQTVAHIQVPGDGGWLWADEPIN